MKELYKIMQKAQGKVDVYCESCNRASPAKSFCRDCAHFICSRCEEAHNTMRMFSEHVIVSIEDLRQNTAVHAGAKKASFKCKEHTTKKVKLYCYDCEQLICRDCIIIDHAGHTYEFIDKAATKCKTAIAESVIPVQKVHADLTRTLKELTKAEERVSNRCAAAYTAIDTLVDKLILAIKEHQVKLRSDAKQLTEKQLTDLALQKKNVQLAAAEAESLIDFVKHNSQGEDEDVLSMKKQLVSRSSEISRLYGSPKQLLKPLGEMELELSCDLDLVGVLKKEMRLREVPFEGKVMY